MEVRIIKTCQGYEHLRFHDGALVPPEVSDSDAEACEPKTPPALEVIEPSFDQIVRELILYKTLAQWSLR